MHSEENWANYHDPRIEELYNEAAGTVDDAKRNALLKQVNVLGFDSIAYIPLGSEEFQRYWWPWVKNYYGEDMLAAFYVGPLLATIWIDQNLKAEMGY